MYSIICVSKTPVADLFDENGDMLKNRSRCPHVREVDNKAHPMLEKRLSLAQNLTHMSLGRKFWCAAIIKHPEDKQKISWLKGEVRAHGCSKPSGLCGIGNNCAFRRGALETGPVIVE